MKPVADEKEAEASRQDCFVRRAVVTAVPFVGVVVISSLNNVLHEWLSVQAQVPAKLAVAPWGKRLGALCASR